MAGDPYPKPSGRRRTVGVRSRAQVDLIRERIFDRDERRCMALDVVSGHEPSVRWICFGGCTIQHAIGRGMGGSALLDRPSLLRTLCAGHNALIEQSALFRATAEEAGWSLPRFGTPDPLAVPVLYPGGRYYVLDDDFGRVEVWP